MCCVVRRGWVLAEVAPTPTEHKTGGRAGARGCGGVCFAGESALRSGVVGAADVEAVLVTSGESVDVGSVSVSGVSGLGICRPAGRAAPYLRARAIIRNCSKEESTVRVCVRAGVPVCVYEERSCYGNKGNVMGDVMRTVRTCPKMPRCCEMLARAFCT